MPEGTVPGPICTRNLQVEPFHGPEWYHGRSMADPNRERSRIANNRLAVAVVVGTLVVAVAAVAFHRVGLFGALVPEGGPAADAVPLYFVLAVFLFALVVWSWGRLLSWFD